MIFKFLRLNIDIKDSAFNALYPAHIKRLSASQWTPVAIAKMAADYLANKPNKRVLDIGSGAGKFCLIGAATTNGRFYGVEQRKPLVVLSKKIAAKHHIENVEFIHSNITQISFTEYDSFYFYNSFFENISTLNPIDNSIPVAKSLYYLYSDYVKTQLEKVPLGTRLVTYYSLWDEIPESFDLEYTALCGILNFWIKK